MQLKFDLKNLPHSVKFCAKYDGRTGFVHNKQLGSKQFSKLKAKWGNRPCTIRGESTFIFNQTLHAQIETVGVKGVLTYVYEKCILSTSYRNILWFRPFVLSTAWIPDVFRSVQNTFFPYTTSLVGYGSPSPGRQAHFLEKTGEGDDRMI